MNIEEYHYGEDVSKIKLDGIVPFGNSYNFEVIVHLTHKKMKKVLKQLDPNVKQFMNVVFQYEQKQWKIGDILKWEYDGFSYDVVLFGSSMISHKGKQFYQYCVGVK
ncbi:TPA: hypothetical protein ME558_003546 [Klebsiella pneumoniae]|uniref:hypothetical protein n=1 Tax=Klebsiella pneumoniae TaxID=573 RepID=UPI001F4AFA44|nr:hypothetical protein [Klebsiella pneumoniae]HEM8797733.1 hypothetical protein [Klebsiella michiganensis]EKX2446648.1 hypothetical protein [Klebsiella pneumoniae]EKX8273945.1 hypothetical protein [Klebsiella pneumoniae]EKX9363491.1 hypothetical protein [Klebsiella pneumoniae]